MKDLQLCYLQLLRDFCHGTKARTEDCAKDLKALYTLSEHHGLDGLMFSLLHPQFDYMENASLFQRSFLSNVFLSVNRRDLLENIINAFLARNISVICMKGAVIRDYYPTPELRSMGDVDLIIHPEDRDLADFVMTEILGFERFIDHHDVWTYYLDQFQFEIHTHMFYDPLANDFDYRSYFDNVWEHCHSGTVFDIRSTNLFVPDEDFHFLYLMAHTAKHVVNNGAGFRSYLDMVLLMKACGDRMDWPWITKELGKLRLLNFTKICFTLCECWFDVKMPLEKDSLEEAFYNAVTEKTFIDGLFGLENEQNRSAKATRDIKRAKEQGLSYRKGSWRIVIQKVFPPYRDLQLVPWYRFLDGKPWLLPAAWVYRWCYCLIHKKARVRELLTEPFVEKDKIEERERLLQAWGL